MNRANSDFWTPLTLADFNARTGHAYPLVPSDDVALEHWVETSGVLLGVIVLNCIDQDCGYVVLGRDERNQFRAIEVACSHPSIEEARAALRSTMRQIAESGATVFPQDCFQ